MRRIRVLFFLALLNVAAPLAAQTVPPLMNYQGRLTDEAGTPLPDGNYELAFRLYSNASPVAEETLIWGRQYVVTLLSGAFNVVLGASGGVPVVEPAAVNDLTFAFTGPNRYLELRVVSDHTDAEVNRTILPRQQLLSSPFALQSSQAERAAVADTLKQEFADMLVPPGTVIAWMGASAAPAGWEFCAGQIVGRTDPKYARLFTVIKTRNGDGDGSTTFQLPDLRGMFLRGADAPSGHLLRTDEFRDSSIVNRTVLGPDGATHLPGSLQPNALPVHQHKWGDTSSGSANERRLTSYTTTSSTPNNTVILQRFAEGPGGTGGFIYPMRVVPSPGVSLYTSPVSTIVHSGESRPNNVYAYFLIKL